MQMCDTLTTVYLDEFSIPVRQEKVFAALIARLKELLVGENNLEQLINKLEKQLFGHDCVSEHCKAKLCAFIADTLSETRNLTRSFTGQELVNATYKCIWELLKCAERLFAEDAMNHQVDDLTGQNSSRAHIANDIWRSTEIPKEQARPLLSPAYCPPILITIYDDECDASGSSASQNVCASERHSAQEISVADAPIHNKHRVPGYMNKKFMHRRKPWSRSVMVRSVRMRLKERIAECKNELDDLQDAELDCYDLNDANSKFMQAEKYEKVVLQCQEKLSYFSRPSESINSVNVLTMYSFAEVLPEFPAKVVAIVERFVNQRIVVKKKSTHVTTGSSNLARLKKRKQIVSPYQLPDYGTAVALVEQTNRDGLWPEHLTSEKVQAIACLLCERLINALQMRRLAEFHDSMNRRRAGLLDQVCNKYSAASGSSSADIAQPEDTDHKLREKLKENDLLACRSRVMFNDMDEMEDDEAKDALGATESSGDERMEDFVVVVEDASFACATSLNFPVTVKIERPNLGKSLPGSLKSASEVEEPNRMTPTIPHWDDNMQSLVSDRALLHATSGYLGTYSLPSYSDIIASYYDDEVVILN